jgi:hypothetical protein
MTRYTAATEGDIFDTWFDLIETDPRTRVSGFIETMIEQEPATDLSRSRYGSGLARWAAPSIDTAPINHIRARAMPAFLSGRSPVQRCAMSCVRATNIRSRG